MRGPIYKPSLFASQSRMQDKMTRPQDGSPLPPVWSPALLLADLAATLRFFSRLPVPRLSRADDPAALPDFRRAAALTPLTGLLLALPGAGLLVALSLTALPPAAAALLALALGLAITGALHADGLADVADGFFGAGRREKRLDIMKDSRIGAFGTLALIVALGLATVLLAALVARHGAMAAALAWLGAEGLSRAVMTAVWHALPPARPEGLAAACGAPGRPALFVACALALLGLVPAAFALSPAALVAGTAMAGLAGLAMARLAMAKIGGQTGDVLGATQQVAILAALLGLAMV